MQLMKLQELQPVLPAYPPEQPGTQPLPLTWRITH